MICRAIGAVIFVCGLSLFLLNGCASNQTTVDAAIVKAKNELLNVQRATYTDLGRSPKSYTREELENLDREEDEMVVKSLFQFPRNPMDEIENVRAERAKMRKTCASMELPTQYEDPVYYKRIRCVVLNIFEGIEDFQRGNPDFPKLLPDTRQIVIGTIPGDSPNATFQIVNPGTDDRFKRVYLLTINASLFRFAEVFSGIVARLSGPAPLVDGKPGLDVRPDVVRDRLRSHPEITQEFQELMTAYLLLGGAHLTLDYQTKELPEPYVTHAQRMYDRVLTFALAHELGHVIYNQLKLEQIEEEGLPAGWLEEYSADAWAITLSLMARKDLSISTALLTAKLYCSFYDLVERGISLITTGKDDFRAKTDHPPAYLRNERMLNYTLVAWEDVFRQPRLSILENMELAERSQVIESVVDVLWDEARSGLLKHYENNKQLARDWNGLVPQKAHRQIRGKQ